MPRPRPFAQIDVFAREPYRGNPVAVILDAEDIDSDEMQTVARWTNLSETAFLLRPASPDADYRVRIFTPGGELPFAGHPTLGSARAWLHHGGSPGTSGRIVQECGVGLIELAHQDGRLAFAAPPLVRTGPLDDEFLGRITTAFGLRRGQIVAHQWVDNGPGWAVVQVATADEVLAIDADLSFIDDAKVGVIGSYPPGSRHAFELRGFAPAIGIAEDPVTGSLNAAVAQWLTTTGQAPDHYLVSQGTRLHRAGEIEIRVDDGTLWVGGDTTVCFTGSAIA